MWHIQGNTQQVTILCLNQFIPLGWVFGQKTRVFEESCLNTIKIEMFWKVEILNRFLAFHHFSFDCNPEHNQTQDQQTPCPPGKLIQLEAL